MCYFLHCHLTAEIVPLQTKRKHQQINECKKESLSLYLLASPSTPIQRQQNKETLELAKKIRFEREQEFLDNREGYRLKKEKAINFLDYYQSYIRTTPRKTFA